MKKIFRMIIFSAVAIFLTAYWNKGFIIKLDPTIFIKTSLMIALVYYLIIPVSKLILLPLNIITLGLFSTVFYAVVIYFLLSNMSLISIKEWVFSGIRISNFYNIFISSFSISTIINLLEKIV